MSNHEPSKKQVDFLRLSIGTTSAHAADMLRGGHKLPDDWEEKLAELYQQAAESEAAVRSAERVKKPKRDQSQAEQAAGQTPSQPEAQG